MSELGPDAREFIARALRDEPSVDQAELVRIRKRVIAAGAGVTVLGSASKAIAALGKASLGPVLKAFGLGVAVTVLALSIPTVLHTEHGERSPAPAAAPPVPKPATVLRSLPSEESSQLAPVEAPAAPASAAFAPISKPTNTERPSSPPNTSPAPVAAPTTSPEVAAPAPPVVDPPASIPSVMGFTGSSSSQESFAVPAAPSVPKSSPLVQELTLLENVQSELRAGHGAAALKLLDRSKAPAGQMQAERLAAEVFASCQAGEVERARAAAKLFLSRYPASPASARVRGSCIGEEAGNAR